MSIVNPLKDFTVESVLTVGEAKVSVLRCVPNHHYEYYRWPYVVTIFISWLLTIWVVVKKGLCKFCLGRMPKTHSLWFDGSGDACRQIKEGSASWRSLNVIYNYRFKRGWYCFGDIVDDFWVGMINAQSVRNRLKLVKRKMREAILQNHNPDDPQDVRVISLGIGSAQGVVELITELKKEGVVVRLILVDRDQEGLNHIASLAQKLGVEDQIEARKTSISAVVKISQSFKPHVIEMLGMLDYIQQDKAIKLVGKIYQSLESNGVFLTCNVRRNLEMYFLQFIINWVMIYRTPRELAEVVIEAGFDNAEIIYDPHLVHGVITTTKN